jgi:serine/threonine-protein kinase
MRREESDTWLGRLVASRYRLIARLGDSTMAEHFLARHVLIDRLSAIKVLRPEVGRDKGLRALFLREAKAVNRINHPNIVEITDYGETDDTAYLVMEYVPGEPLSRLLGNGPLGWQRAARIGLQIALALSRAHEMGVIHRDLKPSNVLVVPQRAGDDLVKLTDFGVAKLLWGRGPTGPSATGLLPAHTSPGYVAPELQMLGTVDARSDLFSLGVTLYECACGALPYAPERPAGEQARPRPIRDVAPDAVPAFDAALARLLAPDPEDRPRDAFEVVAMLREVIVAGELDGSFEEADPPTVRQRPRRKESRSPRLMTLPFDRIARLCVDANARVHEAAADVVRPGLRDDLRRAEELVGMIERLEALVAEDTNALEEAEARAQEIHAEYGERMDALSVLKSRTLGWAGSLAERAEVVRKERTSGAHSVSSIDAMLWEQAAIDHEEEQSRDRAEDLQIQIATLLHEQSRVDEALEREQAILGAKLEGHVAAMRALAGEVWMLLDSLAESLDVRLSLD